MATEPQQLIKHLEATASLPAGSEERFNGYGVMGLPFKSGHILAMRRFSASSVGPAYTSVWHPPEQEKKVSEVMYSILPVSQRQGGIINDGVNHDSRIRYPLENITVPTLVISPIDDGTFPGARYTTENIPGAKIIALDSGGHLLVGQEEKVQSEVEDFLKQHAIAG